LFAPYETHRFFAVPLVLALGCAGTERGDPIPAGLVGIWCGDARSEVSWARGRRVPIALWIRADGSVVGSIGEGRLVDGRLARGRSVPAQAGQRGAGFLVHGRLRGPVLPGASMDGERLCLTLAPEPDERGATRLHGTLTCSHGVEGAESTFAASDLTLLRLLPG
jgi:hypothetical protein